MRIHLFRPTDPTGPWLVIDERGQVHEPIDPTPELIELLPENHGWFEAEPLDDGWDVKGRALDS